MKSLNKTETPIYLSEVCSLFLFDVYFIQQYPCQLPQSQGQVKVMDLEIFLMFKAFKSSYFLDYMMDFVHIWYDDRYSSKVLFSNTLPMPMTCDGLKKIILKCFKNSYFQNHMKDFVHIWHDDRYRSKFLFINTHCPCPWPQGQSWELSSFIIKCLRAHIFQTIW